MMTSTELAEIEARVATMNGALGEDVRRMADELERLRDIIAGSTVPPPPRDGDVKRIAMALERIADVLEATSPKNTVVVGHYTVEVPEQNRRAVLDAIHRELERAGAGSVAAKYG